MAVSKFNERAAIQPALLTFLRIIAGIVLIYKSFLFIRDAAIAQTKIEETGIGFFSQHSELLALVITYLGLLCGIFITIGLFTRVAAIVQIPILLVAVFLVNYKSIGTNVFEFGLSMVILLLLVLFAIKGSGPYSADVYFRQAEPGQVGTIRHV